MSMIFMKEPYGIVCEENKIYLYNYKTQEIIKTFLVKQKVPEDFCICLALGQLIDSDKLLKEMNLLEKKIFVKLMEEDDSKYFVQTDDITGENIENELLKYEAERIGSNYANSLPCNARYKVYKNLRDNVEKTAMVICGAGLIGTKLMEQLVNYSWAGLYLWDQEDVMERDVHHCSFYQREHIGEKRAKVINKENAQINILENLSDVEELQKRYDHIHVVYTSEKPDGEKIREINQYMETHQISWSLLTVDSERLMIGPTLYPGQTGCLSCNLEMDSFRNKYNLMPYEADLIVGMFMSDIGKVIGTMEEAIVEDISVTISRAFYIDRRTMEGRSVDMERHLDCPICGPGKKSVIYVSKTVDETKAVVPK